MWATRLLIAALAGYSQYRSRNRPESSARASSGPLLRVGYRLIGICAGKILKGAKPADLPVDQISKKTTASSPRGTESLRTCMGVFLSSGFLLLPVPCLEVCPGKAGMFSRRQSCRGRSQSPVVRIAEEMETEPSKPIDKTSRGEVTSHRAVTTVNALWPRK